MHVVELLRFRVTEVQNTRGANAESLLLEVRENLTGLRTAEGIGLDDRERVIRGHGGRGGSGSDEFANDIAASEKADEASFANDGHALDILVGHERRHFRDRLFGCDAQDLTSHDVADGATHMRAGRREASAGTSEERRRHQVAHELALAQESKEPSVRIDDG